MLQHFMHEILKIFPQYGIHVLFSGDLNVQLDSICVSGDLNAKLDIQCPPVRHSATRNVHWALQNDCYIHNAG